MYMEILVVVGALAMIFVVVSMWADTVIITRELTKVEKKLYEDRKARTLAAEKRLEKK